MKTWLVAAFACASLSIQTPVPGARQSPGKSDFQPAEAVSVSDVAIPFNSVADGTTVLELSITTEGKVANVQARNYIAAETDVAVSAVRTWKFAPARLDGKAVASIMTVAVTFHPPGPSGSRTPALLTRPDDEARTPAGFQPTEVTQLMFAAHPATANTVGTVILQAGISRSGQVKSTKVLRDLPPFTDSALDALNDWKFLPATQNGRPVKSNMVLVFCFRAPVIVR